MRRFFSALVLFALLGAQAAPGVCPAAGGHVGGVHSAVSAQGRAGPLAHENDAVELPRGAAHEHGAAHHHRTVHQHGVSHDSGGAAAAMDFAPEAPFPPGHDGSCGDLLRCHWVAVPAAEQASLNDRAARINLQSHARDALATDAAALLTPPPKHRS